MHFLHKDMKEMDCRVMANVCFSEQQSSSFFSMADSCPCANSTQVLNVCIVFLMLNYQICFIEIKF